MCADNILLQQLKQPSRTFYGSEAAVFFACWNPSDRKFQHNPKHNPIAKIHSISQNITQNKNSYQTTHLRNLIAVLLELLTGLEPVTSSLPSNQESSIFLALRLITTLIQPLFCVIARAILPAFSSRWTALPSSDLSDYICQRSFHTWHDQWFFEASQAAYRSPLKGWRKCDGSSVALSLCHTFQCSCRFSVL